MNVNQKQKFFLGWVENIAGKGGNAGYQHFLLFHNVSKCLLFQGRSKSGLCDKELKVKMSPTNGFNLDQSKILLSGKG